MNAIGSRLLQFCLSCMLCYAGPAYAERLLNISLEQGLSHPVVYDILQDRQGFMWFAGEDGLNRYDAYQFKVYRHQPEQNDSLCHSRVYRLYQDRAGTLWAGTENGLGRFDRQREKFLCYRHEPANPDSLGEGGIWGLAEDRHGRLWVGTHGGGLQRFEPQRQTFIHYRSQADNPLSLRSDAVWQIFKDRRGTLWIGSDGGGLGRFDENLDGFVSYLYQADKPDHVRNFVTSFAEDANGQLWIGSAAGLGRYDREADRFDFHTHRPGQENSLSHNLVWSLAADAQGNLWVGTDGGGLDFFTPQTGRFQHFDDVAQKSILSLYTDAAGSVWIGTENGLARRDPGGGFAHYMAPRENDGDTREVLALAQSGDGSVWAGTHNGLHRFGPAYRESGHFQHDPDDPHSLADNTVRALFADPDGSLWIGTDGGSLHRLAEGRVTRFPLQSDAGDNHSLRNDTVRAIYRDSAGTLWVGSRYGLLRFDGGHFQIFADLYSIYDAGNTVMQIYEDRRQQLWIATLNNGLALIDRERGGVTRYRHDPRHSDSLGSNQINALVEDKQGNLWIGTAGSGLDRFDPQARHFSHYRSTDGLPGDFIQGLLCDDSGRVWLSSHQGLSYFDPEQADFHHFSVKDGLQSQVFTPAFFQNSQGEMFFGGINGFNRFTPADIQINRYLPPVVLTDFELFGRIQNPGEQSVLPANIGTLETLNLTYEQSFFSLHFAALNYIQAEKNRYAYQLQGFDPGWREAGERRYADYTKVPPGTYIFQLKASNNDGLWNSRETRLRLVIAPPWWLSGPAYAAYILSGLVLLVYLARLLWRKHAASLAQEVDARQRSERALDITEARYRTMVEGTDNLVTQVDSQGHYLYLNHAARDFFGHAADAYIGRPAIDDIIAEDRHKTRAAISDWQHNPAANISFENRALNKQGEVRTLLWSIHPEQDETGHVRSFTSIARDISALKQIQEATETASKAKSRFLATMSHEIRSPMNAILGFSELLLERVQQQDLREYLSLIRNNGKTLLKLLNDILDISKIEAGKLALHYAPTDVRVMCEDIAELLADKIAAKHLDFVLDIDDDLPEVLMLDENRLRQVLLNILGNAVKFTEHGFVKLAVRCQLADDHTAHVEWLISDSGMGIPADQQELIFHAFEQQRGQDSARFGGTGLGLAICKQLGELMGGHISVSSQAGQGSTFNVSLPQIEIGSWDEEESPALPQTKTIRFAPATILIVDDIDHNRILLKEYLKEQPFKILEAADGEQALALARAHVPEIILLDIKMPGMNGDEVARILKQPQAPTRDTGIIAITALALPEEVENIRGLCAAILYKPVMKHELFTALGQVLPREQDDCIRRMAST